MGMNNLQRTTRVIRKQILAHTVLLLVSLFFGIPFVWLLSTSLKSLKEASQFPPTFIPEVFRWGNYAEVFKQIPFLQYSLNTFYIAAFNVVGQLFAAPLVAYSISKIDWWGKKLLFPMIVATMMIPFQVTMVPVYLIFHKIGWVGSYKPLIVPAFAGGAFYIFLLRQFFLTIPDSLIDAARIDGASEVRIYSQIMLPLCQPALLTIGIFTFLYAWQDFTGPLIYLMKSEMYTLSLGLQAFIAERYINWPLLMAATAMFTCPIIIIFFFAQKQFIAGIATTGLKT
jgi:multiple sugar transport system permease protein